MQQDVGTLLAAGTAGVEKRRAALAVPCPNICAVLPVKPTCQPPHAAILGPRGRDTVPVAVPRPQ